MRLSTSTNIYFNRPDGSTVSIQDSVKACAAAGYRVMDLNFYDCTTFRTPFIDSSWRSWAEGIAQLAKEQDVVFSQAHAPFYNFCDSSYSDKEFMDQMVLRSIQCAEILGIPWVVIHAGTAFNHADWQQCSLKKNLEYFSPVVEFAEKHNVGIAIENLWDLNIAPLRRYTAQPEEVMELVSRLNSTSVGICCDVEHTEIMGQDTPSVLRMFGDQLKATHISDVFNQASDHLLPFTGKIKWEPIVKTLKEIGYTGDFTYEVHHYLPSTPDFLVPKALAYSVAVGDYLLSL